MSRSDARWLVKLLRQEPETRWFRRRVMRRRFRYVVEYAGPVENFELHQEMNGISNMTCVVGDPLAGLAKVCR